MPRIGCFDLDVSFRSIHCLSSVRSGRAATVRRLEIRNVRGNENGRENWLVLSVTVGNWQSPEKPVRNIAVGDPEAARLRCEQILPAFTLPSSFLSNEYDAFLLVRYSGGEVKIPFRVSVLSPHYMSTDLEKADELAAYITSDDSNIREFSEKFASGSDIPRSVYSALLGKNLPYLNVPCPVYTDTETVHTPRDTLEKGGSCAEMSLLYASVLSACGVSPLLIEFRDHMASGYLTGGAEWNVIRSRDDALALIDNGGAVLTDPAGACSGIAKAWEDGQAGIRRRIERGEPFAMVNVIAVLRGSVKGIFNGFYSGICPRCGRQTDSVSADRFSCPACGLTIQFNDTRSAVNYVSFGDCRYTVSRQGALITRADTKAAAINVAPVFNGSPVTEVDSHAFENCAAEAVFLPATVRKLGIRAFAGCRALHTLTLPPGITEIGTGAFSGCESLRSIKIPGGVKRVPSRAFYRCKALSQLDIEEGVTEIDDFAFEGCEALETVRIPASVRQIGRNAFAGCDRLKGLQILGEKTVFT